MRRQSLVFFLFAVMALVAAGCTVAQKGETVVKYRPGGSLITTEAPVGGMYALYSSTDLSPKVRVHVSRGDTLGFETGPDGQIVAVAGEERISLAADRSYYWRRL
jgi:hypothetical protein